MAGSALYLSRHRFPLARDPYKAASVLPAVRAVAGAPSLQCPLPFRFSNKDTQERVAAVVEYNAGVDTLPADVEKKAFELRLRQPEKELAHSKFRIKSFSTIDRLNVMYEDDSKIMDCELMSSSPKKRIGMPAATKKYLDLKKKLTKKMGS